MKVIIAEKPSVARDIARVLKVDQKADGYFSGNGFYVTWAFGHLIQLQNPDDYDEALKKWRMDDLPFMPEIFLKQVNPNDGAARQLNTIKQLLVKPDVDEAICATDAGREGELIFRYIYEFAGVTLPIKRLWISSQTDKAIKEGFAALKPGENYEPLYDSARSRSEADWLVGMNATRAYTIAFSGNSGVMSVGRVQTPVLKLIVDRYEENINFKPTPYFEIMADFSHEKGDYQGKLIHNKEDRLYSQEEAESLFKTLQTQKQGRVASLQVKDKQEKPPLLYDLTELQKDANRKYKYSADQTLKILQGLYEQKKVLTYPRTSSRYLSTDMVPKLEGLVAQTVALEPYQYLATAFGQGSIKSNKRIVDDAKVTDHHAIIPTETSPALHTFSEQDFHIYDLVMRRFLSVFLGDCLKETTEVMTQVGEASFRSAGTIMRHPGWRAAYGQDDEKKPAKKKKKEEDADTEDETVLPPVVRGDSVGVQKVDFLTKETKAPPLYNEASILAAMETAGKTIDDEEMRQAMKDCGLGTPATRAQILERLVSVNYVVRDKNRFIPTDKGIFLIRSIKQEALTSPALTGEWEQKLNLIAQGKYDRDAYMQEIRAFTSVVVDELKKEFTGRGGGFRKDQVGACPKCQGSVVELPKSFSCANWKSNGCTFVIWKGIAGKEITATMVKTLLKSGATKRLKGFKSKQGKSFDAALKLDADHKVVFDFSTELGTCPLCEGAVIDTPKSYACSKWRETGCAFTVWKTIAGKTITEKHLQSLLKEGKTELIKGFKSRTNELFDGVLCLKEGRVQFFNPPQP